MSTRFELIFKAPQKKEPPFTPYARICLRTSMKDDKGNIYISPDLPSLEFDNYVDILIRELNEIKSKAQKKFNQR